MLRKSTFRLFLIYALSLTGLTDAGAGIYKWVDADGQIQFSDRPPLEAGIEEVKLPQVNTYQGVNVEDRQDLRPEETPPDGPPGARAKKVVMYSASWCGVCTRARRLFNAEGIPFQELDVDRNRAAKREWERMNAKGVPVILVGNKRMNGFSEERFMALYRM